jgi:dTDP-4-amino-4,6-dideoxygalactose transaminase
MFYLLAPSLEYRQALIAFLHGKGIQSVFHYLPLHLSDMGRRFGGRHGDCPVTEDISDRLLRLPFHTHLGESDQMRVIESIKTFNF